MHLEIYTTIRIHPQTSNDTDEQITRILLQVTHTFLPVSSLTKSHDCDDNKSTMMSKYLLLADTNGTLSSKSHGHPREAGHTTYFLKPVIYSSQNVNISDFHASYQVHNLGELRELFENGINVEVRLNVVTFTRDEEQDKQTEKGNKTSTNKVWTR